MDTADPTLGLQPAFVGLATVCGIDPDIRGGVVAPHYVVRHAPVLAHVIGGLALADEAEGAAGRDAAPVVEARDGDVWLRSPIDSRPSVGLIPPSYDADSHKGFPKG